MDRREEAAQKQKKTDKEISPEDILKKSSDIFASFVQSVHLLLTNHANSCGHGDTLLFGYNNLLISLNRELSVVNSKGDGNGGGHS